MNLWYWWYIGHYVTSIRLHSIIHTCQARSIVFESRGDHIPKMITSHKKGKENLHSQNLQNPNRGWEGDGDRRYIVFQSWFHYFFYPPQKWGGQLHYNSFFLYICKFKENVWWEKKCHPPPLTSSETTYFSILRGS